MTTFMHDPAAVLDYGCDWSAWLGSDTITSSTWVVPAGLTKGASSIATGSKQTSVWLSGGAAGRSYTVTNRIVTAGGRTDERSFVLLVQNR